MNVNVWSRRARVAALVALLGLGSACATPQPVEAPESQAEGATEAEDAAIASADDPLFVAKRWLVAQQDAGTIPTHHEIVRVFSLEGNRLEVIISPFTEPPANDATRLLLTRAEEGWEVVEQGTIRARKDWPRY